jgi:hypothetical protein
MGETLLGQVEIAKGLSQSIDVISENVGTAECFVGTSGNGGLAAVGNKELTK